MLHKKLFLISLFCLIFNSCTWLGDWFGGDEPKKARIITPDNGDGTMEDAIRQVVDSQIEPATGGESSDPTERAKPLTEAQRTYIKAFLADRCLKGDDKQNLAVNQDVNVYGTACFSGLHLKIKTAEAGAPISTSKAVIPGNPYGIRLEGDVSFINRVYELDYTLLEGAGSDQEVDWLASLLPVGRRFFGSPATEYRISFEIMGNYLVLLKASQNLDAIPYIERTSCVNKDAKGYCASDTDGFYKAPFLAYPISRCYAAYQQDRDAKYESKKEIRCADSEEAAKEQQLEYLTDALRVGREEPPNGTTQEQYLAELSDGASSAVAPYIKLRATAPEEYTFLHDRSTDTKTDLLPADFFDGEWFLSHGPVEFPSPDGELPPFQAVLVKLKKTSSALISEDISGNISEKNRDVSPIKLPVQWQSYTMNQDGERFVSFGEKLDETENTIERPYLQINFDQFSLPRASLNSANAEITDLLITRDYFSFSVDTVRNFITPGRGIVQKKTKYKVSFLRRGWLNETGFVESRFFVEDHNSLFGTMNVQPQTAVREGDSTLSNLIESRRNIKFNTSSNRLITWHFSKNSCKGAKGEKYRLLARRAVEVYNQGFALITPPGEEPIQVTLSDEEKDLGDLRYNIINLVCSEDRGGSALMGAAPSYVNFDTGQIIGATANILLHNIESIYEGKLRDYIRYEIFQKGRLHNEREKYDRYHVVTPYMRSQIEALCPSVTSFISKKKEDTDLKPYEDLEDTDHILSCRDNLIGPAVLYITLHEIGHSCLGHNFKCSSDKKNYYQSPDEMRRYFPNAKLFGEEDLPQSACVMDYLPLAEVALPTVLGKYDLAGLRWLYWDRVETRDGNFILLNTPKEPENQTSILTAHQDKLKPYSHCSHEIGTSKTRTQDVRQGKPVDLLCKDFDFGSTPKEVVQYHIETFYRAFNSSRYRYDSALVPYVGGFLHLQEIALFHRMWIHFFRKKLLNRFNDNLRLISYNLADIPGSIEQYQFFLDTEEANAVKDYNRYKEIREPVFDFIKDLAFMPAMKCEVENQSTGDIHLVDLEHVRNSLLLRGNPQDAVFVRDCLSPAVLDFFATDLPTEGVFSVVGQEGVENFQNYWLSGSPSLDENDANADHPQNRDNIAPWMRLVSHDVYKNLIGPILLQEPDLFDRFRQDLGNRLFSESDKIQNQYDMSTIQTMYQWLFRGLNILSRRYDDIKLGNMNRLKVESYGTGTRAGSFSEDVLPHLRAGGIEALKIPFLTDIYFGEYMEATQGDDPYSQERIDGFQDYLIRSDRSIDQTDPESGAGYFLIPVVTDSLSARMIVLYNGNRKRIEELDRMEREGETLSFFQEMTRTALKERNDKILLPHIRRWR